MKVDFTLTELITLKLCIDTCIEMVDYDKDSLIELKLLHSKLENLCLHDDVPE